MRPAPWKILCGVPILMMVGGGFAYWVQWSKLRLAHEARLPVRPAMTASLEAAVIAAEQSARTGDPAGLAELGSLYQHDGHLEAALRGFAGAHELDPVNFRWPLAAAELALELGRKKEATEFLRRAGELGLIDGESAWRSGLMWEALRDQVAAKRDYERAVELDPQMPATWFRLITLYRAIGDRSAVRRSWESAVAANPDSPLLLMERGRQYRDREQWGFALQDFQSVIQLRPEELDAHYAAAQMLFQLDRVAEGREMLDHLLQQDPADDAALTLLCVEGLVEGDRVEVERHYARLATLPHADPRDLARIRAAFEQEFGSPLIEESARPEN